MPLLVFWVTANTERKKNRKNKLTHRKNITSLVEVYIMFSVYSMTISLHTYTGAEIIKKGILLTETYLSEICSNESKNMNKHILNTEIQVNQWVCDICLSNTPRYCWYNA